MKIRTLPFFKEFVDGTGEIRLNDYEDFDYVIREMLLDYPQMIYRGQKDSTWPLRSSIDRLFFEQHKQFPTQADADKHLSTFKSPHEVALVRVGFQTMTIHGGHLDSILVWPHHFLIGRSHHTLQPTLHFQSQMNKPTTIFPSELFIA